MMKYYGVLVIFSTIVVGLKALIPNGLQVGYINHFGFVENPGTFPYIVRLEHRQFNTTINAYTITACGGSIIRTNTILTAAHCVVGAVPENVMVIAGIVHTLYFQEHKQSTVARRIVSHENFINPWINDIALVFLASSFFRSDYVKPIPLAKPFEYLDLMSVTAVGWGNLANERQTEWLHRGDFLLLSKSSCARRAGLIHYEKLLCVLDAKALQKVGSGDSGGPLVHNNVLVGVTVGDHVHPLNDVYDPTLISAFSNVSYYENWILENIARDNWYFVLHHSNP